MGDTKISWADKVWNPVTGCTKVSEGCRNCYAERMSKRLAGRAGYPEDGFKVTLHADKLGEPLRWKKPTRIFVCSMGDLFHKDVPDEFIAKVLDIIEKAPQHIFMVLTKRPERAEAFLNWCKVLWANSPIRPASCPPSNLWLGTSVEDQKTADERIPLLLQTPAAKRFVSYEPALGPVDLTRLPAAGAYVCALRGARPAYPSLDWVIMGGESGPGARPMHPDWARSTRDQCQAAGVPFFFKQWGEWAPVWEKDGASVGRRVGKKAAGCLLDGKEHKERP